MPKLSCVPGADWTGAGIPPEAEALADELVVDEIEAVERFP